MINGSIRVIDVNTGEVKAGTNETILRSNAIGSCIVIVAYDPVKKMGGLAHVMVPGTAPDGKKTRRTIYAADAVEELMNRMIELGVAKEDIETCLVGGGNVLERNDDTISEDNINSVIGILTKRNLLIKAKSIGGTDRRTVSLDVQTGCVRFTEGDGPETLLWKFGGRPGEKVGD
ncbi:MAG: chemotaxis protein CheD [Candidatus Thermoplasmatota archaeon]|nr:chemotaxis protein CheD [Candidatus Thermoplasmatota archaeon]